jgi:hypothetical protein
MPGWRQVNEDWFGYPCVDVPALAEFNGHLYAGRLPANSPRPTEGPFDVWRTEKGTDWERASALHGFSASHLIEFDGYLYLGTSFWQFEYYGRNIFRSPDGLTWTPVVSDGFEPGNSGIARFVVFDDTLYASTWNSSNGTHIWRTTDGVDWIQFGEDGFGDASNDGAIVSEVYDGLLYYGTRNLDTGAELWRTDGVTWSPVVTGGFSDINNVEISSVAAFNGHLYAGLLNENGVQVWRSQDGTQWDQVESNGFGNPETNGENALKVFEGQLYLVVSNYTTGLEVWRTADGTQWTQIGFAGFGDIGNKRSSWGNATTTFKGSLYIGTDNLVTGCEVWQMLQSQLFLPLVARNTDE